MSPHLRDRVTRLGLLSFFFWLCAGGVAVRAQVPSADCDPAWLPAFGPAANLNGMVHDFALFDDGQGGGPALYAAGEFSFASGTSIRGVARWDGASWHELGTGIDGSAYVLEVFDDGEGSGLCLYVGGNFSTAGGAPAAKIARWDGQDWSALAAGLNGDVVALEVFDDGQGGGPALYLGGYFGVHVAKWTGSGWSTLGGGVSSGVSALAVYDDGSGAGPALVVGGNFNFAGGQQARRIARWDGTSWSPLGLGVAGGGVQTAVLSLAVHDDGTGSALYAGGEFHFAGGQPAQHVARWNGTSWSQPGAGSPGALRALASFDAGSGPQLYGAGFFLDDEGEPGMNVAAWDGSSWQVAAGGWPYYVECLAAGDLGDGRGPRLLAGGDFFDSPPSHSHIAAFDGAGWAPLTPAFNQLVRALVVFDDAAPGGPALYAGGSFTMAGGVFAKRVARWDGAAWSPLGEGTNGNVAALAVHDDGLGGGPALYAAGDFTEAGGVAASRVARWDGASWSPLGAGMDKSVTALASFDPVGEQGPHLYACGPFTLADGQPVTYIARWDGTAWSAFDVLANDHILALAVFDDGSGSGPALFAGGRFGAIGTLLATRIARFDGTSWSQLGSGITGSAESAVLGLSVFDAGDGEGPAFYVGGDFHTAGGQPANGVARWDGASWSALGGGITNGAPARVSCLAGFDDGGGGPALFVGGNFAEAGGAPANHLARWDGQTWSALQDGAGGTVNALAVFDDGAGGGPKLVAAGSFATLPDTGDSYFATWGGCAPEPSPWTHLGYALPGIDGPPLLAGTGALVPATPGSLALTHAAPSAPAHLLVSLGGNPTPFKGGVLVPLPVLLGLTLGTSPAGALNLSWPAWPGGLSGLSLYFQYAIVDAAAVHGLALSNALRADVP